MKKRKFFSYLFMGLLAVGATGTVTSCKDYDDDINENKASIQSLQTALTQCKTDCETARNTLQSQLEAKDAELTSLVQTAQNTANANKSAIDSEIARAQAAEAALEARIKTCDETISQINTLLAGKVDQSVYDETVKDIYAKLESVQTDLGAALTRVSTLENGLSDETTARQAAIADVQQQINALKALGLATNESVTKQLEASLSDLQSKVYTKDEITNLLQTLSDEIDKVSAEVNVLNVLIRQSLRSLVFVPDLYYWGVEGTKLLTLDTKKYTLPTTAWNKVESNYNERHTIYPSSDAFKILSFTANYHMNPSSADKNDFKSVKVISDDKEYINTRSAACGLSVKDYDVANGILSVDLNVANKNLIKTVLNDQQVTVFATQVNIAKGNRDTTITSDYATLIKDEAQNLYIFHKKGRGIPYYNVENTHCGACAVTNAASRGLGHLFETTWEAGKDFLPQDSCNWNDSLDLSKLVETHYIDIDGKEKVFDAAKYGLSYKFELTGLYFEGNRTSESAHAAINGSMFRPQMPAYDANNVGQQQAYGAVQGRQTIGRTPLVRVSLVDDENGNVYAYGYIRIKITEAAKIIEEQKDRYISYDSNTDYNYNQECTMPTWSYSTKWIQTEYDLYHMVNLTREEFESIYTPDYESGSTSVFKQYALTRAGTQVTETNPDTGLGITYYDGGVFGSTSAIGTITYVPDASLTEDGTRTSVIRWNMTAAQANTAFNANRNGITRAVKLISNNKNYPDVYVVLKTGKANITTPSATVKWTDAIISNYWYATNANSGQSGTDEIHANVYTPEDAPTAGKTIADFNDTFSDVFSGNFTNAPSLLSTMLSYQNLVPTNRDYVFSEVASRNKLTVDFIFASANVGKTFTGESGTVYTLGRADGNKTLTARAGGVSQPIAKIEGANYRVQYVALQETNYAKDLLNASAHNDLAGTNSGNGKALEAIIGLSAVNTCNKPLAINGETFNVRFLRPLNVRSADNSVEDANVTTLQVLNLVDLVQFNDWRDSWNHQSNVWGAYGDGSAEYAKYYGIKAIKIDGVSDGGRISANSNVKTSLGQANVTVTKSSPTLSRVSDQLDFIYHEDATDITKSTLTYRNLSSTLSTCQVLIPVSVEYYWGTIHTDVIITINATAHNAKRH